MNLIWLIIEGGTTNCKRKGLPEHKGFKIESGLSRSKLCCPPPLISTGAKSSERGFGKRDVGNSSLASSQELTPKGNGVKSPLNPGLIYSEIASHSKSSATLLHNLYVQFLQHQKCISFRCEEFAFLILARVWLGVAILVQARIFMFSFSANNFEHSS